MQQKRRFAPTLKLLLIRLSLQNPPLYGRVKDTVLYCIEQNGNGDRNFSPLLDEVEWRVMKVVGKTLWRECEVCAVLYLHLQSERPSHGSRIP